MSRLLRLLWKMGFADLDIFCVCQPDSQLVAVDPKLNGISHRGVFYHRHLGSLNQSHIQEMLPQGTLSSYYCNCGSFPDGKVFLMSYVLVLFSHM